MATPNMGLTSLFKLSSLTLARQAVAILSQLLIVVVAARILGATGNGQYAVALLLPQFLTTLLVLGIPAANVYFLARGDVSLHKAFFANLRLGIILSLIGIGIGAALILGASSRVFPGVGVKTLWLGLGFFPFSLLLKLLSSTLQGVQDLAMYNLIVLLPFLANLGLLIILLGPLKLGVFGAMLAWGLGQLFAFAVILNSLWRRLPDHRPVELDYTRRCLNYGWRAHASNAVMFLNYRVDIFLVNLFVGAGGAGVYVVAVQVTEVLWLTSQAVGTVLLPKLSELKDDAAREELTPLVTRWVNVVGLVMGLGLAFSASLLVPILFGATYRGAASVIMWLLPGAILINGARILANDIAARGRPELNIWTASTTLLVNLAGTLLLIPRFGLLGAAAATSAAYITTTAVTLLLYSRLSPRAWRHSLLFKRSDLALLKNKLLSTR